jgi:hypothetical protein
MYAIPSALVTMLKYSVAATASPSIG